MTIISDMLDNWHPPSFASFSQCKTKIAADKLIKTERSKVDIENRAEQARLELKLIVQGKATDKPSNLALQHGIMNPDEMNGLNDDLYNYLISEAVRRNNKKSANMLFNAFIHNFDPKTGETKELINALKQVYQNFIGRKKTALAEINIFATDFGIDALSKTLISIDDNSNLRTFLAAFPRIFQTKFGAFSLVNAINTATKNQDENLYKEIIKIANSSSVDGVSNEVKRMLYAPLLQPYLENKPDISIEKIILPFILENYGDPRDPKTPTPNIYNDPDSSNAKKCEDVVKKWLALETLELFFEIIDNTAVDHMWSARKKFWLKYFDGEYIADVRIVLASEAKWEFDKIKQLSNDYKHHTCSILSGSASSDQSVLLMKIGSITMAEWSHNGKLRFWDSSDENAPQFNKRSFDAWELRNVSLPIWNNRSNRYNDGITHSGYWQTQARNFIHNKTGVRP
ncbi:MAG: EH signature domain-containing protein [Hyphomicrobiales bacterium]